MTPPGREGTTESPSQFWLVILVIELFVLVAHLNGLRVPHVEGDEVLFAFLATRLAQAPLEYNLQGTVEGEAALRFHRQVIVGRVDDPKYERAEVLYHFPDAGVRKPRYDPTIYDQPLFLHPPIYPYSLAVTQALVGLNGAVFLSALCHGATILLTGLLGRQWAGTSVGLLAAGLVAIETISWISAERLWIDAMLETAVTGAMLAAVWSMRKGTVGAFLVAGACLGMAGLVKLPAGAAGVAVLVGWLLARRCPEHPGVSWRHYAAYILAAGLPVMAWMLLTLARLGSLFPVGNPTPELLASSQYLRAVVDRSPLYYIFGTLFASPILLYMAAACRRSARASWMWIAFAWAGGFLIVLSVIGILGLGFQLRYLAPAMPACCLLAAAGFRSLPLWARVPMLPLVVFTLHVAIRTAATLGAVDPPPPHDLFIFFGDIFGVRLMTYLEWIW